MAQAVQVSKQRRQAQRKALSALGLVSNMVIATAEVVDSKLEPVGAKKEKKLRGTKVAMILSAGDFQERIAKVYEQTKGKEANGQKRMRGLLDAFRNTPQETIKAGLNVKALGLKRNTDQYTRAQEVAAIFRAWVKIPNAIEVLTADTVTVTVKGESVTSGSWRYRIFAARQIVKDAAAKQDEREARAAAYAKAIEAVGEDADPETLIRNADEQYESARSEALAKEAEKDTPQAHAQRWAKACVNDSDRGESFAVAFALALPAEIQMAVAAQQAKILAKLQAAGSAK